MSTLHAPLSPFNVTDEIVRGPSGHLDESTYRLANPSPIIDDPTDWMSPEERADFERDMESHALAVAQNAVNARKPIEKIVSGASRGRFAASVAYNGATYKCGTHTREADAWTACERKAFQLRQG